MISVRHKDRWSGVRLYLVLDRQVQDYQVLYKILKDAVRAGVDIVQLRDKFGPAKETLNFAKRVVKFLGGRIPFVINDRIDITLAAGADGVHLGQEDISLPAARKLLGPGKIIGCSCQTLAHALKAQREGADYIGFGSVFKTQTKPERDPLDPRLIQQIVRRLTIPIFFIGGIDLANASSLFPLGVSRIAVTRAISLAVDPVGAVKAFKVLLDEAELVGGGGDLSYGRESDVFKRG
jgi:thiamine-phosphate pyrophosphorylase